MTLLVGRRPDGHDDYRNLHRQMSRAQLAFVDAARLSLDGSQQSLDWRMGGPGDSHLDAASADLAA
jgi:hypothetical protein